MSDLTPRPKRRVYRDFPHSDDAERVCRIVANAAESERVQAAIVLASAGSPDEIRTQARLATTDWRDVLLNGPLASSDWEVRLNDELGPS